MAMAVPVGNGRYCKLFSGASQPKRLLIDDISEPGLLTEEYIQGIVARVFPIKESPRYGKLCKVVLSEDLEDAPMSKQLAAVINVFLLGELANEGSKICQGDRVVLLHVIAECSPTDEHHFQLLAWREKSPVSIWVISKNGKVIANKVDSITMLPVSLDSEENLKACDTCLDNNAEEENDIFESHDNNDFYEHIVCTRKLKGGGKQRGKFQLGPRGVTPSHADRTVNNLVLLNETDTDKIKNGSNAPAAETDVERVSVTSERPVTNGIGSIEVETNTQAMSVLRTPTHGGKGQSLSLRIQNASPTPEHPSNVQCAHIELTPSGVTTRVWNHQSSFHPRQETDSCQVSAVERDSPHVLSPARQGPSHSPVVERQVGENNEQTPGGNLHRQLSEDSTLPIDDQDQLPSPASNKALSTCSCQSQLSVLKGARPLIRAQEADLTPKSSISSLIPKDYTPAATLLSCEKVSLGGVKRSPSEQHSHDPKRVRKSVSPEPGPLCQAPSSDCGGSSLALPVTKTSQPSAGYSVPSGYTTLANLQPDTTINIYGVVKLLKPAWKCRGTDMCSVLVLMDPTVAESGGLECVSFQPSVSRLPNVQKVGDIVRLHRIKITQYQGRLQAKSSRGFAAVVFDREVDLPVTAEMARVSSSTFTLTQSDKDTVESLKRWCESHPLLFPPPNFLTVSQISPDSYFDLVCQVLGMALHHTIDCVVLFVTDGTQPRHDIRNCEGDDYSIVEPLSNHAVEDSDVVSVFLYGSHAEVARLLAKKGEYLILHNVHSQVLKPGGPVCSVLDVVRPFLELCVHRGTAFGRGLTVLSTDSPEVKQLKRNQGGKGHR